MCLSPTPQDSSGVCVPGRRLARRGAPTDIASDGRSDTRYTVPFGATDMVLAPNGDLFVADARHNRICRDRAVTGAIGIIAGSGAASTGIGRRRRPRCTAPGPGRNGDSTSPTRSTTAFAWSHTPRVSSDGCRRWPTPATGDVGDGGPASAAHLARPTGLAVAPNGDLYIADTGHNRVRRVSAATGIITTVAGDGVRRLGGDGGRRGSRAPGRADGAGARAGGSGASSCTWRTRSTAACA